ncbi:MAG: Segregation and condensation protein [Bacteroidota bacterium]
MHISLYAESRKNVVLHTGAFPFTRKQTMNEQDISIPDAFLPVLEALIFASDEPMSEKTINELLVESEFQEYASPDGIKIAIDHINDDLAKCARPYSIVKVAGGYHFVTRSQFGVYVQKLLKAKSRKRLSQAALETLSIVAYKQPVSKPDIEAIRGVNSGEIMNSLLDRGLVTIIGRAETAGRPLLYGTTAEFLRIFGLAALDDLPRMKEIDELIAMQPQNLAAELGSAVVEDINALVSLDSLDTDEHHENNPSNESSDS